VICTVDRGGGSSSLQLLQQQRRRRRAAAVDAGYGSMRARRLPVALVPLSLSLSYPPALSPPSVAALLRDRSQADWKKLRVKELRKICEDEGIDSKGFTEKDEFLKAIKAHFNIKDEI
jgi:hypothetical protein